MTLTTQRWHGQQEYTMSKQSKQSKRKLVFVPKRFSAHDMPLVGRRVRFSPEGVAQGAPVLLVPLTGGTFNYPCGSLVDVVAVDAATGLVTCDTYEPCETAPAKAIVRRVKVPADALLSVRGAPYVAGDDERRAGKTGRVAGPVAVAGDEGDEEELGEPDEAWDGEDEAPEPVTPAVTPVADPRVADALATLGSLLGGGKSAVDEDKVREIARDICDGATMPLADDIDKLDRRVKDIVDALASATPAVRAAVRRTLSPTKGASGNAIVDALSRWYVMGEDRVANVLLASPPSLGKSYAVREFGRGYDVYLEHGCSEDASEVDTLLGSPVPDGAGGFVVVDGVLSQAVRAASEGKSVLLLLDEVLRLSRLAQEWLLSFLTGRRNVDGSRSFVLRTRRVMPDGTLEVLQCPAESLHIVGATNLGMTSPVEAFWSRWETIRFSFDPATIRAVSLSVLAAHGVTGAAADKLAAGWTQIVTESRVEVAKGTLRYPADIRMLERAVAVSDSNAKAVATLLSQRIADNCANWSADLGDMDVESKKVCDKYTAVLMSLATTL